jgi:phosphatidylinositol alpha-1,6-mannosyltransferase
VRKPELLFVMTGACATPGGISTVNLNIMHALVDLAQDRGSSLTILSFLERDTDRPVFLPDWVAFTGLQRNKLALAINLLRLAIRRPVCCYDHVTLALPALPFAIAGFVKTIIFAHGSEAWRRIRKTSRWSFRAAALCLTNSEYTLGKMRERLAHFNGKACPLGLSPALTLNQQIPREPDDLIELQAADGVKHILGERVLLLVGRMHPGERQKGHYPLLHVLPDLLQEYPDVQLVFAGPGDDRSNLEQLARCKGIAHAVFLPGHVPVQLLERLYQRCYAFVMPSKQEGFGLVYLEAMNYGKACVGCFGDGAEEVIVHRETGLLVSDPNQHEQLLAVLQELLCDPERTQVMGRNGFARLHRHFTARHVQERIKRHIGSVL